MSVHNLTNGVSNGQIVFGNIPSSQKISWQNINALRAIGNMFFDTDFASPLNINIMITNQWEKISSLSTGVNNINFSFSTSDLTTNLDGIYHIIGSCTFRGVNAGIDNIEFGYGINGAIPVVGTSLGGSDVGTLYTSFSFVGISELQNGDFISLFVRNKTNNDDVQIASLNCAIAKVAQLP